MTRPHTRGWEPVATDPPTGLFQTCSAGGLQGPLPPGSHGWRCRPLGPQLSSAPGGAGADDLGRVPGARTSRVSSAAGPGEGTMIRRAAFGIAAVGSLEEDPLDPGDLSIPRLVLPFTRRPPTGTRKWWLTTWVRKKSASRILRVRQGHLSPDPSRIRPPPSKPAPDSSRRWPARSRSKGTQAGGPNVTIPPQHGFEGLDSTDPGPRGVEGEPASTPNVCFVR